MTDQAVEIEYAPTDDPMVEIARALGWPLDDRARQFYRLAEMLPPAEVKAAIVDAAIREDLMPAEAQAIIRALGLEHE